ncbi:phosphoribosyltransferase [Prochlorococcus sp. MIT 1223]|uniref:phosphoribosyltransferase n=1 Tax=Prochlorococcus sp. MIT 1223 TaxID=3096217 RepID=UPI002A766A72|nr:phosphoribosyltransferase [Prochlorococcus sp. MIT 1223]
MRILSWDDFDICIKSIVLACDKKEFCGVYGIPRGGICLAVALSHALNIPFLDHPQTGCLVVDDVYETGTTLSEVFDHADMTAFVWCSKVQPKWWNAIDVSESHEWIIFPWENIDFAVEDECSYKSRRL